MTSRPARNRQVSSRLTDGANGEAPSADASNAVTSGLAAKPILDLIKKIGKLSPLLPETVPEAPADDDIHRIITRLEHPDGTVAATFNRRFDILFGEDTRGSDGRLKNIRRGDFGMGCVVEYLNSIHWESARIPFDLTEPKLTRVANELEHLCGSHLDKRLVKSGGSSAKTKANESSACTDANSRPSFTKEPGYEQKMDRLDYNKIKIQAFQEKAWRRPRACSEEADDDFDVMEIERPPTPEGSGKRRRVVIDDEGSVDEASESRPKKKAKKAKQSTSLPSAPPKVTVVEISDSDSDDERPETKRGPRSTSRNHFHPPIAVKVKGEKRWEFKCRHCKASYTFQRTLGREGNFSDEKPQPSLGNLATHIRTKHGNDVEIPTSEPGMTREISEASAKIMESFLREGKLNPALNPTQIGFNRAFAAWIIEDDLAFTTGETPGIQRVFDYIGSRFGLPSDTTVRNTLAKLFCEMFETIKSELANVKSKIAASTDTWSTRSMMFTFAGTIASWVSEDWQLIERVIDFHPIGDKEHEGVYAAASLAKRLSELDILEKISLSLDNASTNDVLIRALSDILRQGFNIQWAPENSQIRCIAHVVNLVVQKILATLDEAHDPEERDYYVPNKDLPFHYDPDGDPELIELEKEQFDREHYATTDEDSEIGLITALKPEFEKLSAVGKLRMITIKICSSPQRRQRFKATSRSIYTADERAPSGKPLTSLMVIRDVKTRWNYTEAMITRGLLLRKAIDQWVFDREELRPLLLTTDQWKMLESLGKILTVFTQVTLEMSRSGTPTLPFVLLMYEIMMTSLREHAANELLLQPLRVAATAGLVKLTVYYEKAKQCQFNVIATMLHPGLGLAWFQKIGSERAEHARILFEFVFDTYKKAADAKVQNLPPATQPRKPTQSTRSFLDVRFYDAALTYGSGELNAPLAWWKIHERDFPVIAAMARDFFAIPGTSVSVEHLFSKSRHLCRETRSSMHADTIMKAMLTKMWIKAGLFKLKQS
ncbi:Dimer-Tnp-hAT domain-containing protein [Mycena venus]|uniref:Dimer-Tnp-hAT domain-containing protein n=1 Tax=Mycena venus TaxID=2733690 RepID=A0A8H6WUF4_9AGAR|nr:Dimer-Tnp-hAT domain-containing protein [Mycena venus]